jgi:hypothetical protein
MRIYQDHIEAWLGTDCQVSEMLDILTALANGEYTLKNFREEVREYNEELKK